MSRCRSLSQVLDPLSPFLCGVPWGRFPRFTGHKGQCDFSPPFPRHFVSFVRRYHPSVPDSLPGARNASPRAWVLISGPPTAIRRWRRRDLPRFLGNPHARMPRSGIPADLGVLPGADAPVLPSTGKKVSAPRYCGLSGLKPRPARSLSTLRSRRSPSGQSSRMKAHRTMSNMYTSLRDGFAPRCLHHPL